MNLTSQTGVAPAHGVARAGDAGAWLARAADDPSARHPRHLPETLDLTRYADLFLRTFHAAPAGTELGFPVALAAGGLHFPAELAAHARHHAYVDGHRLVGTFHVHPADRAPFFDPADLANALRSDYPGFLELLLARDRLFALVRANPFLYIGAHHVNRNPLLLAERHGEILARKGGRDPAAPDYARHYRQASLYFFQQYGLALYEGDPREPLRRTVTPEGRW